MLDVNVKTAFYRNPTIFLSAAKKTLGYECASSFEIISAMKKDNHIMENMEHDLKYAVAVSCEVRLKVYEEEKRQADSVKLFAIKDDKNEFFLYSLIGKKSIVDFFTITLFLVFKFSFKEPWFRIEEDTAMKLQQRNSVFFLLGEYFLCFRLCLQYLEERKGEESIGIGRRVARIWKRGGLF